MYSSENHKKERKKGDPLQTYNILLNFPSWSSPKDNKINQKIEACLNQSKRSPGTTSAKVGGLVCINCSYKQINFRPLKMSMAGLYQCRKFWSNERSHGEKISAFLHSSTSIQWSLTDAFFELHTASTNSRFLEPPWGLLFRRSKNQN